jgi:hypothetical protein
MRIAKVLRASLAPDQYRKFQELRKQRQGGPRQIGLRMAVGARRGDILRQFLIEAMTLCLTGGFIGMLIGGAAAAVIQYGAWPIALEPLLVVVAMLSAALVSAFFGYYSATGLDAEPHRGAQIRVIFKGLSWAHRLGRVGPRVRACSIEGA